MIVKELIQTEKSFVEGLKVLREIYVTPVRFYLFYFKKKNFDFFSKTQDCFFCFCFEFFEFFDFCFCFFKNKLSVIYFGITKTNSIIEK